MMVHDNEETNGTPEAEAKPPGGPTIPEWINEENFIDLIRDICPGFKRIIKFEPALCGGAGENYASIMLRVNVKVELEGSKNCVCCYGTTIKELAFMVKTMLQSEQGFMMNALLGLFPKETSMYSKYFPEFEQMFADSGKKVNFGPKYFSLKKNPANDYILLEDLGLWGFKNVNRLEGLDQEYTESVLRLLADLHAVSAVRYETKGDYGESFSTSTFIEKMKPLIEGMFNSMKSIWLECSSKYNVSPKSLDKMSTRMEQTIDIMAKYSQTDPEEFNVLNHGDLWANNIMFRQNDEGKLEETVFVDLQLSRYGSPANDLWYFLMSSVKLELKCSMFDYFIKYYHTHLVENLKQLNYPKKIPTMKDLRLQLLKYSFYGLSAVTGVMTAVLLDPTENASIEGLIGTGEEGNLFKKLLFSNSRYIKHIEIILPWMETRGLLDE